MTILRRENDTSRTKKQCYFSIRFPHNNMNIRKTLPFKTNYSNALIPLLLVLNQIRDANGTFKEYKKLN